jgi:hypothetical protein
MLLYYKNEKYIDIDHIHFLIILYNITLFNKVEDFYLFPSSPLSSKLPNGALVNQLGEYLLCDLVIIATNSLIILGHQWCFTQVVIATTFYS